MTCFDSPVVAQNSRAERPAFAAAFLASNENPGSAALAASFIGSCVIIGLLVFYGSFK
jgi:hypothetical protein